MNSLIARVIVGGITFLLLKLKQTAAHNCKSPYTDSGSGLQGADCSKVLTGAVPEDLGDISFLDISNNTLPEISEKSFSKYASLRGLVMQSVTSKIQENAFSSLKKLEFLDMTKTFVGSSAVKWPPTLKNLTVAECSLESLNIPDLNNLESLNASNNKLKEFPNLYDYAPLVSMDIRNNSINNISTKHISFYCNLKFFGLTYINAPDETTDPQKYCNCANLIYWMDLYGILPGSGGMNCSTFTENLPTCREYLLPSCKERRLCFRRAQLKMTMVSRILIIIATFIISVLLLIAVVFAKPVYIPKVADTHPFEHHDAPEATNVDEEDDDDS